MNLIPAPGGYLNRRERITFPKPVDPEKDWQLKAFDTRGSFCGKRAKEFTFSVEDILLSTSASVILDSDLNQTKTRAAFQATKYQQGNSAEAIEPSAAEDVKSDSPPPLEDKTRENTPKIDSKVKKFQTRDLTAAFQTYTKIKGKSESLARKSRIESKSLGNSPQFWHGSKTPKIG